jgi:hypothetical protein
VRWQGLMLGVAILCRPENLFFPFFWRCCSCCFTVSGSPGGSCRATLVIASMVVLTPWLVRNYQVTG